jgi:hypothetical protein
MDIIIDANVLVVGSFLEVVPGVGKVEALVD